MSGAQGPQQPDEAPTIRTTPMTEAERRELAAAAWLWGRDNERFGGPWTELPHARHHEYIQDARDLLDRRELFLAPPSAEPVLDRLAEAREAVARWLCDDDAGQPWERVSDRVRGVYRSDADEILALPAVRALLAGGPQ